MDGSQVEPTPTNPEMLIHVMEIYSHGTSTRSKFGRVERLNGCAFSTCSSWVTAALAGSAVLPFLPSASVLDSVLAICVDVRLRFL